MFLPFHHKTNFHVSRGKLPKGLLHQHWVVWIVHLKQAYVKKKKKKIRNKKKKHTTTTKNYLWVLSWFSPPFENLLEFGFLVWISRVHGTWSGWSLHGGGHVLWQAVWSLEPGSDSVHHAQRLPPFCGQLWHRLWLGQRRSLQSLPGECMYGARLRECT